MSTKLGAKIRNNAGKGLGELRVSGLVPGVVYGHGVKNINVAVPKILLEKVFKVAGESTLVELEIEGDKTRHIIINDVQVDPVKGSFKHVDFLEVRLDEKIKAEVPLEFIGEAPAVKELAGTLIKNIHHVEVEALPQNLPHSLEVDLGSLKTFEDHLTIADIKVSSNVKILTESDQIVASVAPPRTEAELEEIKGEVVEDVSKVEGVVKEEAPAESGTTKETENKE